MPLHTILIKPASGLCNMRCDYCFYCDEMEKRDEASRGMMSEETLKNLVKKAMFQAQGKICFAFQGGEPTLRGIDFFRKALEYEQRFNRNRVRVMKSGALFSKRMISLWEFLWTGRRRFTTDTGTMPPGIRPMQEYAGTLIFWKNMV